MRCTIPSEPCLLQGRPPAASRRLRLSWPSSSTVSSSTPIQCRSIVTCASLPRGRRPRRKSGRRTGFMVLSDAAENYSVGRWCRDVEGALDEVVAQGRVPILVGGTGLYFKALTAGLAAVPPIPPISAPRCARRLQREGAAGAACRTCAARPCDGATGDNQ